MARSFDQILAEVTSKSDPQRKIVLDQVASLPTQQAADEASLEAKRVQANDDILTGARRRGLGYAGIPLGEQAKYNATDYMPAVANLKTSYGNRKATLESALADIGRSDYTTAQDIFNADRAFEESRRQFDEQMSMERRREATSAGSNNWMSALMGGAPQASAKMQQRGDKGFNFQDGSGKAISAAQFAQIKGIPFRELLTQMAKAGDSGAQQALGYVGDDFGFNKAKLQSQGNANLANVINALLWGVGGGAKFNAAPAYLAPNAPNKNAGVAFAERALR